MKFIIFIGLLILTNFLFAQDNTPPDTPIIDSVSVYDQSNGHVIISWFPSDSADVVGYVIYRSVNALWQTVATVPTPATSYIDITAQGNFHPELYRIAAYDEAGNYSPMTPANQYQNTIYTFPYQDSLNCHFAIRLTWNRYINWAEGVKEYQIFYSQNGSPYTLLATANGSADEYYHMDVDDNSQYCYVVRAVSNLGKTSTSNKTCYYTNLPNLPEFINADYATVENNAIKLSFTLDTNATICNYKLFRSESGQNFLQIASYNQSKQLKYTYTDNNVNVENNYHYKLVSYDQCNNPRLESNLASNIVVKVQGNDEVQNLVQWNYYRNWIVGTDSVKLYRIIGDSPPELIDMQLLADTFKLDDLTNLVMYNPSITNKFCYYVELSERIGNPYGVRGISKSNIACATQFARVFVPNTFSPDGDGLNDIFKPSTAFVSKEGYSFKVFDRWGGVVFETTDPSVGWDGKSGVGLAPPGMYTYFLKYKTMDGSLREKAGPFYIYFP